MTNEWYIERQGRTAGPFSGSQLKELAASGRLRTDDSVQRGQDGKAAVAGKVQELFSAPAGVARPTSPEPASSVPASSSTPLLDRPAVLALLLILCFPLALFFIWRRADWSRQRRWSWTGAGAVVVLLMGMLGRTGDDGTAAETVTAVVPVQRKTLHAVEPKLIKGNTGQAEMLTEGFLPSGKGWQWTYRRKLLKRNGETDVEWRVTLRAESPERLVEESLKVFPASGPPSQSEVRFSASPTTVQRSGGQSWEPLVYIGARPGDEWETEDSTRYRLVSIVEDNGQRIATITATSESVLNGERIGLRDEIVLREGTGLVSRTRLASFNGQPEPNPNYIEELVAFDGANEKASREPRSIDSEPDNVDVLTAEFLPAEAGWEWNFSDEVYDEVTGREASKAVVRCRARDATVIEVEEQMIRPIRSSTPTHYEIQRRASGEFISWGRSNALLPLVKLGARSGESWTAPDGSKIRFVGFKDEKKRVAQVAVEEPANSGGRFIRQLVTLEKGSGVSHISFIVVENGRPSRSPFRIFSRTSTANIP